MTNFEDHLKRQIAFSRSTFGPDERMEGVIDHIMEELEEIRSAPNTYSRPAEWVDVVLLALDGLWRSLDARKRESNSNIEARMSPSIASTMVSMICEKQNLNELRDWPDWRDQRTDKAINHDRTKEPNDDR